MKFLNIILVITTVTLASFSLASEERKESIAACPFETPYLGAEILSYLPAWEPLVTLTTPHAFNSSTDYRPQDWHASFRVQENGDIVLTYHCNTNNGNSFTVVYKKERNYAPRSLCLFELKINDQLISACGKYRLTQHEYHDAGKSTLVIEKKNDLTLESILQAKNAQKAPARSNVARAIGFGITVLATVAGIYRMVKK